jgi:hypothetical protein
MIRARPDDLECRATEDELVILDLRTQRYLSLNRTGAELWPLIVEGASQSELTQSLRERYALSEDVAARDVAALVTQLRDADLLEAGGVGAPADG